jgi:hypothetical protein
MAGSEATLLIKIKELGADAIDKISDSLGAVMNAAKWAGAAFVAMAAAGIAAFKEEELAINKLNQAMVNNGDYTAKASQDLLKFAANLQATSTFSDDAAISSLALAKSFGVTNDQAKQLVSASSNLATALGMDLEAATKQVAMTIGGTVPRSLALAIPALKELTEEQLKAGAAIDLVSQRYAGFNEASISGLGALDQFKNVAGDFMEQIGGALAPAVSFLARKLTDIVLAANESSGAFNVLKNTGFFVAEMFLMIQNIVSQTGTVIGGTLATAAEAGLLVLQGKFSEARAVVSENLDAIAQETLIRDQELEAEMAALQEIKNGNAQLQQEKETAMLAQTEANKTAILKTELDKRAAEQKKADAAKFAEDQKKLQYENQWQQAKVNIISASANLITEIMGSGSKAAFLAQKAAALAQAYVATNVAAAQALAVPPAPNLGLASVAKTAGYINMAAIAASTIKGLAEGGIVKAQPGGMPAIIGEGGRDEAVIPLEDGMPALRGMGSTIVIQAGAFVGDASSARQFAKMVDLELFKLRQDNSSVSFEGIA